MRPLTHCLLSLCLPFLQSFNFKLPAAPLEPLATGGGARPPPEICYSCNSSKNFALFPPECLHSYVSCTRLRRKSVTRVTRRKFSAALKLVVNAPAKRYLCNRTEIFGGVTCYVCFPTGRPPLLIAYIRGLWREAIFQHQTRHSGDGFVATRLAMTDGDES